MGKLLIGRRSLLAGSAAVLALPLHASAQQAAPAGGASTPASPANPANGSAVIDVNHAQMAPIPIAIPAFAGGGAAASTIVKVITDDLAGCGLFHPLAPASFVQAASQASEIPDWNDWKVTGARALVTGKASASGGQLHVEFRLWDVLPQKQLQGTAYSTTTSNARRVGHMIADVVYQRLLGDKGYFDTRIAYTSDSGPARNRIRRLAIMDYDGANNRFLTNGRYAALEPRFHPTKNEIAFLSYAGNRPHVYMFDLGTGRESLLGNFPGMTFAPRFSPDGSKIVLSETQGAGSYIVVISLGSMASTRLTDASAINTSPCYSPDGSQITFNSDRDGQPELYIMGADGSAPKRISYGQGRYFSPVWSPRGDLIAFIRQGSGGFGLGVMNVDGTEERMLSEGFMVDSPTFCPNGRVIMFSRSGGGGNRLAMIDITGFNERMAQTPTDASDPSWSPLLS